MDKLSNALSISHVATLIAHGVSAVYSGILMSKVSDAQKYSLVGIGKIVPEAEGLFANINPMTMIFVLNIISILTMVFHIARRASANDEGAPRFLSYDSYILQFFHISSYGITHFLALWIIFLVANLRDVGFVMIMFVAVLSLEALQHFVSNPAKPQVGVTKASRAMIGFFAGATPLLAVVIIVIGLNAQDLPDKVLIMVSLVVLEGMKFLSESIAQLDFFAEFAKVYDSRVAHAIYDMLIKTFLVWYVLLKQLEKQGGIDGKNDLSTQTTILGWIGTAIFGLYVIYSLVNRWLAKNLPKLTVPELDRADYPSATMEEKSRMLQVA